MNILVCIKRVPAPGAKIVLTQDAQDIETAHLGFTMSPHEECAVEEAVQIVEKHGGSTTVLALGPTEAEEQLRHALSVGANRAVLLQTDGEEWDPISTAAAIAEEVGALEGDDEPFDLILFGQESADSGGYQVGIRVAYALGRPVASGAKGIEMNDGTATAKRETADGFELYEVALPGVIAVKEGINLPRYPGLRGRLWAKNEEIKTSTPQRSGGGPQMVKLLSPPEQESTTEILGEGAGAAPRVLDLLREVGLL